MQGNQSLKFLKKVDLLERELRMEPVDVLMKGLQFVQAFRAFLKVVNSCFGMSLREGFEEDIIEFKRIYLALDISVTPKVNNMKYVQNNFQFLLKVHIVFQHIVEFLKLINNEGLPAVGKTYAPSKN